MVAPCWTAASSACRRSGVSPCGSIVPCKAPPRRSRSPKRRMAGTPASRVRRCPRSRCPSLGRETGIDVGLKVFLVTADGEYVENPGTTSQCREGAEESPKLRLPPEEGQQAMVESGWALRQEVSEGQAPAVRLPPQDGARPVREYDVIYLEDLQVRNLSRRPKAKSDGNGGISAQRGRPESRPQQMRSTTRDGEAFRTIPHLQGSVRRQASGSATARVHHAGL